MKLCHLSLSIGGAFGSLGPVPRGHSVAADLLVDAGSEPDVCLHAEHWWALPAGSKRTKGGHVMSMKLGHIILLGVSQSG